MTRVRLKNRSAKAKVAGTLAALTIGASLIAAPNASADTDPGPANLLNACNWANVCDFHPQSYWTYTGPVHKVSEPLFNCGNNTNSTTVTWSDTTGSSNSVGVSVSQSMKFAEVYETEIQLTYQHTWLKSHTYSQATTVNVSPNQVGWIERGTDKQQAMGWWEIHFNRRYYGHYIWYIRNYRESGPTGKPGYINTQSRPMTSAERWSHCHR